mgnify:FL=1
MNTTVKIVNQSNNPLPAYQTEQAAGMDLCAYLNADVVLQPLQRQLIPTGLFIELSQHTEAQIRPRSGLAFKHGITVLNSPGTTDADYRGVFKVLLVNLSNEAFTIKSGERIAQMVVAKVAQANLVEVQELTDSVRAASGFGSTGK